MALVLIFIIINYIGLKFRAGHYKFQHSSKPSTLCVILEDFKPQIIFIMDTGFDNIKKLFDTLKTLTFWQRLFHWRTVKTQLFDAVADLQRLADKQSNSNTLFQQLQMKVSNLGKDLEVANQRKTELETELIKLKKDLQASNENLTETKRQKTDLELRELQRQKEHGIQIAALSNLQDTIQKNQDKETQQKIESEKKRVEMLKFTWSNHQENVKQVLQNLCKKHLIEYVEKVPFKGNPDNTIKICGEFIIFDAKCPRGEDLGNFPNYIKDQVESIKKYAKEENVKRWLFIIIPSNTLEVIKCFSYSLADYDVFVVSVDALEPLLLNLRKLEEYDAVKRLSPEERENICRILGKFVHLSKRRIQIDTYFINQFIELSYKCDSDLPLDIRQKSIEFEKAEILNPPTDKRTKALSISELEKTTKKLRIDTSTKGIIVNDEQITNGLNELQLYDNNIND